MFGALKLFSTVVLLGFHLGRGYPLDNSLGDPCGGGTATNSTGGQGGMIEGGDLTAALTHLTDSAITAANKARTLIADYRVIRIPDKTVVQIRPRHLTNLPSMRHNFTNVTNALQNDYDDVSKIVIYMDNVYSNENSSSTTVKYTDNMTFFQTSLRDLLCSIKIAADIEDFNVLFKSRNGTMPADEQNIQEDYWRYERDFMVVRDAENFLKQMSTGYTLTIPTL